MGGPMIFLYTALLLLVGVVHFLIKRRVAGLEKKYSGVVKEADDLLRQSNYRDGNSNRQDPYQTAKRQYKLAILTDKRDHMEAGYTTWHRRAERLGKLRHRLRRRLALGREYRKETRGVAYTHRPHQS